MQLRYCLVDVFTDRAFGGNPLAVFTNPGEIPTSVMQALAKEMNLSETTFVLPPADPAHDFRVRIFTPVAELPMAGHPTVGTAFVLARDQAVKPVAPETTIIFEEGVGPIPVTYVVERGDIQAIQMRQLSPTFGQSFSNLAAIAEMLSLGPADLDETLPVEIVSCGMPILFIPIKNLEAIRRARVRLDVWERVLSEVSDFRSHGIFLLTREVENAGSTVHCRMFGPGLGITEDPATGAASGPLGCYLVHHGVVQDGPIAHIVSEQGIEMGRPSFIQILIEHHAGEITGVRIAGQCVFMGEGTITLP